MGVLESQLICKALNKHYVRLKGRMSKDQGKILFAKFMKTCFPTCTFDHSKGCKKIEKKGV